MHTAMIRRKEVPTFFGEIQLKGERVNVVVENNTNPVLCNGMHEKTPHPTQKPEELLRKLILASSHVGDTVLDPFCGSGTTPVCAEQLRRKWMACDLSPEYPDWAADRINRVEEWSIEKWMQYDMENIKRRNSIR